MPSAIVFGCHGNQTRLFRSARNLPIISYYEFRSGAKGSILVYEKKVKCQIPGETGREGFSMAMLGK